MDRSGGSCGLADALGAGSGAPVGELRVVRLACELSPACAFMGAQGAFGVYLSLEAVIEGSSGWARVGTSLRVLGEGREPGSLGPLGWGQQESAPFFRVLSPRPRSRTYSGLCTCALRFGPTASHWGGVRYAEIAAVLRCAPRSTYPGPDDVYALPRIRLRASHARATLGEDRAVTVVQETAAEGRLHPG